ncbi:biotin--[acetyl-CoA-carboxylase] ligase [Labrenzia sp. CE80]|uniref:biotin--[acetyl-CoA-carboxylase] ligase n=1 Tax=Labrenzia sp. CE80 TaxID=1788986 RepID=UPI001AD91171|nr:biotin--[acetyl-CoA-carboxylase] ligase [Labrenzia sp. CE80]
MPGLRVERHGAVGSTNNLAFERARSGDPGGLWIVAEEQSDGRGRRGRDWVSPRGNLFASHFLLDPGPRERLGEVPLVAAVALADAIDKCAGTHQMVGLKWPNDLLVDGAKLSGILLEAESVAGGRTAMVLGFGVNCVAHPEHGLYPTVDLAALGHRISADQLFNALALSLDHWLSVWRRADGFKDVRKAWLARAVHLGKTIRVRNGDREMAGTFLDLDNRGHLVLGLENGQRETIFAGDVFLEGLQPEGSPDIPKF